MSEPVLSVISKATNFVKPLPSEMVRLADYEKKTKDNTYRGDLKVRKVNTREDWLPPEYEDEWIKCKLDPLYFICSYIKTKSLDSSDHIYFDLHDYQVELLNEVLGNRLSIAMMARQMGKTVTILALIVWYIVFNNNFKAEVVSYLERDAKKALKLLKDMYERLPFWMQHGVESWGTLNVTLDNGSSVDAKSSTGSRGGSLNFLYIDELSFIQAGEEFWASVYPTIESGKSAKITITSTPRGMNFFHTLWVEADIRGFVRIEKPYWAHPERNNDDYVERTKRAVGPRIWIQEYLCRFEGSSDTLLSGKALADLKHKIPIAIESDGIIDEKIFEQPEVDGVYIVTADTSEGVGADYSAFHVIRVDCIPFRTVYSFSTNYLLPHRYAYRLADAGESYNWAYIVAENNSVGHTTLTTLVETIEYPNVLYTARDAADEEGNYQAGVRMNVKTKREGCINLKAIVEHNLIDINDLATIKEFFTFEKKGVGFAAIKSHNDDRVMSFVNFASVLRTSTIQGLIAPDFNKIFDRLIEMPPEDEIQSKTKLIKKPKVKVELAQPPAQATVQRVTIGDSSKQHKFTQDYTNTMASMFSSSKTKKSVGNVLIDIGRD